ncbi:MAG: hypothetical protein ACYS17_16830, partial [Planctomycetota bacterium]
MKHVSIVLLIVMISMAYCAINQEKEIAEESKASSLQPEPLDDEWNKWLIGKWEVTGGQSDFLGDELEGLGESNVEGSAGFTIESGLNGQFLIVKSWSETGEITDEQMQHLKETLNASDEDIKRMLSQPFK